MPTRDCATDLLFVYGTLRSRFVTEFARYPRANSDFLGCGLAQGALRRRRGYPAFTPGAEGEVAGELYRLRDPARVFRELDAYEGDGYERIVIRIAGRDAWVYAMRA